MMNQFLAKVVNERIGKLRRIFDVWDVARRFSILLRRS